ncbi:hypothetical protein L5515_016867 [Caenorhabditis briggsae]|uniref:Uncharacterized protein n=1 Tax=Caenorhabditis briggsae TaxID=6238 RepID=A0AAE9FDB4_CAEBR|nr:hypothetical protein L5515_016867 [Caenorhabditis briggsae]
MQKIHLYGTRFFDGQKENSVDRIHSSNNDRDILEDIDEDEMRRTEKIKNFTEHFHQKIRRARPRNSAQL